MIYPTHIPAIFTTAYLPPISFFVKACETNGILLEQHENYNRQTYRNRCRIPGPNGVQALSIPLLQKHGEKIPICEIQIDNREPWQRLHWRSLTTAYNNSPFFLYYMDDLQPFYEKIYKNLFDYNLQLIHKLVRLIGLDLTINLTEEFHPEGYYPADYRYKLTPKKEQDITLPNYIQVFSDRFPFCRDMSIVDLLFNEGPAAAALINPGETNPVGGFKPRQG